MSEKQGITTSDDVDTRTKYTEIIPSKRPKVSVTTTVQKQKEIKLGS